MKKTKIVAIAVGFVLSVLLVGVGSAAAFRGSTPQPTHGGLVPAYAAINKTRAMEQMHSQMSPQMQAQCEAMHAQMGAMMGGGGMMSNVPGAATGSDTHGTAGMMG